MFSHFCAGSDTRTNFIQFLNFWGNMDFLQNKFYSIDYWPIAYYKKVFYSLFPCFCQTLLSLRRQNVIIIFVAWPAMHRRSRMTKLAALYAAQEVHQVVVLDQAARCWRRRSCWAVNTGRSVRWRWSVCVVGLRPLNSGQSCKCCTCDCTYYDASIVLNGKLPRTRLYWS